MTLAAAALTGLAVTLTAPLTAMAQDAPILKLKENNRLHANGDGHFVYEIKLPVAAYTAQRLLICACR